MLNLMAPDERKPRILLVEDEAPIREHLRKHLSDEFDMDVASDGAQALRAVMNIRPDLVITDVVMPSLNGIELLKTLRTTPGFETIPVLLISGHAPDELRIEGFKEGADGYLTKPYNERELRVRVRSMLRASQLRTQSVRREVLEQTTAQAMAERAALLESITDAFYALDADWRFTYVNQRALDYFGRTRDELLGKNVWSLFPNMKGTVFEEHYVRAMREEHPVAFEALSPYSKRWIDARAFPTPQGLAVNFRDITKRKESEDALRQAEQRYRAFVANSSEGIWRYELDEPLDISLPAEQQIEHLYRYARLAELNDAMARMYGYESANDLRGARLQQTLPRTQPASLAYLREVIRARYDVASLESTELDREGKVRYFSNSMVPVIEGGKLLRAWGMQRDITASKLAEQQLLEADRRKDEFLAVLAHELRNPLSPIRTGLQILRLRQAGDGSAQQTIGMMDRQVTHLVRLVDDLLDVSRITSGRLELRFQRLALAPVLSAAMESTRDVIAAQGHELVVDLRAPDLHVEGDPDRLAQVFANLLSNSAKYTNCGGRITIVVDHDEDGARIEVHDTGIGISREGLDHVFDLFAQVHPEPRAAGGLGIGLSLVRSIVQLHGGCVTAFSNGPGTGSTFTVRLPLASSQEHSADVAADAETLAQAPPLRILVADDNADAAESLAALLRMQGHDVRTAADGHGAVEVAREFQPAVIFMDVGMPRMDGMEATRRIRGLPHGGTIHIVALTGWGQLLDRERTKRAGMDAHLTKPIGSDALHSVLSAVHQVAR
jgi:PAS domain S-box-containing protein